MFESPLHPAVVHLPLGLAFVVPLLALVVAVGIYRDWFSKRVWTLVILLQALVLAGGLVSANLGEREEERVEKVVAESVIEQHEERAELFNILAGCTLGFSILPLILRKRQWLAFTMVVTVVLTVAVLGVGVLTGKSGGELVYRYGAAKVYLSGEP